MTTGNKIEPTLMIIDDDDIDVRVILRALRKQGIENETRVAHDGVEALEMLRREPERATVWPWILLLDVNMPRLNGHEFLLQLRADPELRDSIVFMLTTSDREQDIREAYANNVAGYIAKSDAGPNFSELATMLHNYLSCTLFHPREERSNHG